MPAKRTTRAPELAAQLGVHEDTPARWAAEGCPHRRRGRVYHFDPAEVAAWLKANGRTGRVGRPRDEGSPELEAARLRKENALAAKYELQVAAERGELLDAAAVQRVRVERVVTCRSRMMNAGAALAPRLVGLDAEAIRREIDRHVSAIVEEFARP